MRKLGCLVFFNRKWVFDQDGPAGVPKLQREIRGARCREGQETALPELRRRPACRRAQRFTWDREAAGLRLRPPTARESLAQWPAVHLFVVGSGREPNGCGSQPWK